MIAERQKPKPADTEQPSDEALVLQVREILADAGPSRYEVTTADGYIDGQLNHLQTKRADASRDHRAFNDKSYRESVERLEAKRKKFDPAKRRDALIRAKGLEAQLRHTLDARSTRMSELIDLRDEGALTPELLKELKAIDASRSDGHYILQLLAVGTEELRADCAPGALVDELAQLNGLVTWLATAPAIDGNAKRALKAFRDRIHAARDRLDAILLSVPWAEVNEAAKGIWNTEAKS